MLFKKWRVAIRGYKFKAVCVDDSVYAVYARDFNDVIRQHRSKFVYMPKLIEPMDDIKGTSAIEGANTFKTEVKFVRDVFARNDTEAIREFQTWVQERDIIVRVKYPAWKHP